MFPKNMKKQRYANEYFKKIQGATKEILRFKFGQNDCF